MEIKAKKVSFNDCKVGDLFIDEKNEHFCRVLKKSKSFFGKVPYVKIKATPFDYDKSSFKEVIIKYDWEEAMKDDYKL